jgi:hypothetical protein
MIARESGDSLGTPVSDHTRCTTIMNAMSQPSDNMHSQKNFNAQTRCPTKDMCARLRNGAAWIATANSAFKPQMNTL